jgi:plasmid maintenance system antidote protein VapI
MNFMVIDFAVTKNRLGEILKERDITATDLARSIGRYPHVVRRIVTGERNAGDVLKRDIANGLGMRVSDIFYFNEP